MIDHDRLFKELLTTFFVEFIELFFPQMLDYLDRDSITFLDKEVFTDITQGDTFEADIVAHARFTITATGEPYFLILLETQSYNEPPFGKRLLRYFARFWEKYDVPVYPIVLFSYDQPQRPEPDAYRIAFPDLEVINFRYRVVQLNRLNWRDYVSTPNPVAAALMAKMNIAPKDRWRVKLQCLRLLVTLRLDRARMRLISGFVDTYLRLNRDEKQIFEQEMLTSLPQEEREMAWELTTSWREEGIEEGLRMGIQQGMQQGLQQGTANVVLRQLERRFGPLEEGTIARINVLTVEQTTELGEALLDFADRASFLVYLDRLSALNADA